jgi:hypothetical protein
MSDATTDRAPTIDPEAIRERVARGARLLDEKRPGWEGCIALDHIEMDMCDSCILGFVYGHYHVGSDRLFGYLNVTWEADEPEVLAAEDHGFNACLADDPDAEYAALAVAWRAEIARRTKSNPSLTESTPC